MRTRWTTPAIAASCRNWPIRCWHGWRPDRAGSITAAAPARRSPRCCERPGTRWRHTIPSSRPTGRRWTPPTISSPAPRRRSISTARPWTSPGCARLVRPGGWLAVMTCFQTDDARFAGWHYRKDPTHVVFYREADVSLSRRTMGLVLRSAVQGRGADATPLRRMTSWLHEERLTRRARAGARERGAPGARPWLWRRRPFRAAGAGARIEVLIGLDIDAGPSGGWKPALPRCGGHVPRIDVRLASMTDPTPDLAGYDCAVLVETIEHIDPDKLSKLENALFRVAASGPRRDHHARMPSSTRCSACRRTACATPITGSNGTARSFANGAGGWLASRAMMCTFHDIAGAHPDLGGASQMAVFSRRQTD